MPWQIKIEEDLNRLRHRGMSVLPLIGVPAVVDLILGMNMDTDIKMGIITNRDMHIIKTTLMCMDNMATVTDITITMGGIPIEAGAEAKGGTLTLPGTAVRPIPLKWAVLTGPGLISRKQEDAAAMHTEGNHDHRYSPEEDVEIGTRKVEGIQETLLKIPKIHWTTMTMTTMTLPTPVTPVTLRTMMQVQRKVRIEIAEIHGPKAPRKNPSLRTH